MEARRNNENTLDKGYCTTFIPSHPTPASVECWQLCVRIGLLEHSSNWLALEVHWTSSKKMGPVPAPKWAKLYATPAAERYMKIRLALHYKTFKNALPVYAYPSCLQTTVASVVSQRSSHTVPHWLLMHTSTLPSYWLEPPTRRMLP